MSSTFSSENNVYTQRIGGAGGGSTSSNYYMGEGDPAVGWSPDTGCAQLFRRIGSTGSVTLCPGSVTPHHRASAASLADVIETDYLQKWNSHEDCPSNIDDDTGSSGRSDIRSKGFPTDSEPNLSYGTFPGPGVGVEEQIDLNACRTLRHVLTRSLNTAAPVVRGGRPHRLVARNDLVARIATDVVRMSQNEPLGTAGCLVRINLEGGAGVNSSSPGLTAVSGGNEVVPGKVSSPPPTGFIAEVRCGEDRAKSSTGPALAAPTCEVILSLREDDKRWHGLGDAVLRVLCCRGLAQQQRIYISPAYKLEKIKLYATPRIP